MNLLKKGSVNCMVKQLESWLLTVTDGLIFLGRGIWEQLGGLLGKMIKPTRDLMEGTCKLKQY